MEINWIVVLSTGLVPLVVGALWYGPLFNDAWMKESGMTLDKIAGTNMAKLYGTALVFGLFLAVGLMPIVNHQMGLFSLLQVPGFEDASSEIHTDFTNMMTKYGSNFRSFKHGAFHGLLTALFIFLPVMATNALFERKSWKYIFINVGYWAVSAMLMGGIICAWA